jgi:hypothetical protein
MVNRNIGEIQHVSWLCLLLACKLLAYSLSLKMEAAYFSETSLNYQATQFGNPWVASEWQMLGVAMAR